MGKEGERIEPPTLLEVMAKMPDPRSGHGRRHPLGAILGLAVYAMLGGCRSLYAISQWGRDQGVEVSQALGFTRDRTPCVSTMHQVLSRLDREAFELLLGQWLGERGLEAGEALAIDGKRWPGIHGEQLPEVHLVAAYAHRSAVAAGATGYLQKYCTGQKLVSTLRDVVDGELRVPAKVLVGMAANTRSTPLENEAGQLAGLTGREKEVLGLFAQGMTYAEVAEIIGYRPLSVRNVIYGIQNKLKVKSKQELAVLAVRGGLLDDFAVGIRG